MWAPSCKVDVEKLSPAVAPLLRPPPTDPSRVGYLMHFHAPFGEVKTYVELCGLIEEHLIIKFGPLRPTFNTGTTSNEYIV